MVKPEYLTQGLKLTVRLTHLRFCFEVSWQTQLLVTEDCEKSSPGNKVMITWANNAQIVPPHCDQRKQTSLDWLTRNVLCNLSYSQTENHTTHFLFFLIIFFLVQVLFPLIGRSDCQRKMPKVLFGTCSLTSQNGNNYWYCVVLLCLLMLCYLNFVKYFW